MFHDSAAFHDIIERVFNGVLFKKVSGETSRNNLSFFLTLKSSENKKHTQNSALEEENHQFLLSLAYGVKKASLIYYCSFFWKNNGKMCRRVIIQPVSNKKILLILKCY